MKKSKEDFAVPATEAEDELEEAGKPGPAVHSNKEKAEMKSGEPLKHGGKVKRRSGGMVPGKEADRRPDRRARGGGLADTNPYTAAGNMSAPSYQTKEAFSNGKFSAGKDSPGKNG